MNNQSPYVGDVNVSELMVREWPGAASQREERLQVIVRQSVLNEILSHARSSLSSEICGVIVGDVVRDGRGPFVYIEESIRGEFAVSQVAGVTFTAETWAHLQGIMEKQYPGKRIVGWYHSHPDFGIFLSKMDLFIHRHFFDLPWQVAFVCDPIRSEDGMFVWRCGSPEREAFIVEKDAEAIQYDTSDSSVSKGRDTGPDKPFSPRDSSALQRKVRRMSAGMVATLAVSLVWPVLLIMASQRIPWAREIFRSREGTDSFTSAPAHDPDMTGTNTGEHRREIQGEPSARSISHTNSNTSVTEHLGGTR